MIELLFFNAQFQCGAGAQAEAVKVEVYHEQQLVETMVKGDSALLPVKSVDDLTFEYSLVNENASCGFTTPSAVTLSRGEELPGNNGFDGQASVSNLLANSNKYEELFLVELGETNQNSSAFDLQDVVFKVDNDPNSNPPVSLIYPD